jgi:hypothetical protein
MGSSLEIRKRKHNGVRERKVCSTGSNQFPGYCSTRLKSTCACVCVCVRGGVFVNTHINDLVFRPLLSTLQSTIPNETHGN